MVSLLSPPPPAHKIQTSGCLQANFDVAQGRQETEHHFFGPFSQKIFCVHHCVAHTRAKQCSQERQERQETRNENNVSIVPARIPKRDENTSTASTPYFVEKRRESKDGRQRPLPMLLNYTTAKRSTRTTRINKIRRICCKDMGGADSLLFAPPDQTCRCRLQTFSACINSVCYLCCSCLSLLHILLFCFCITLV